MPPTSFRLLSSFKVVTPPLFRSLNFGTELWDRALLTDIVKLDNLFLFQNEIAAQLHRSEPNNDPQAQDPSGIFVFSCKCLHEYGIHGKILGLTGDNTSNNNTLVNDLSDLLNGFQGSPTCICCFAHVLNLVVKAIMSQFSQTRKASSSSSDDAKDDAALEEFEDEDGKEPEELEMEDSDEIDPAVQLSDSAMVDEVAAETDADGSLPQLTPEQITLANFLCLSPTIHADLELQCKAVKIKPLLMICDVSTRWNSTASMLERALQLREALKLLVVMEQHNRPRGARLTKFKISREEWDLLGQLFPVLDLDGFVDDTTLHSCVCVAAARGRTMLNKYYGLSDDSIMYQVAMLLYPRYKSAYFIKAGWPSDWIKMAEDLLRTQWREYYKPASVVTDEIPSLDSYSSTSVLGDPVDEWLSTPALTNVSDGLSWWAAMAQIKHPLAPMALDFLSAPATSTDVEQAFSRGRLTISKMCHSLSDESTRAATVLSSWCDFPPAIPHDEIIATFRDKNKRPKGEKDKEVSEFEVVTSDVD
ncbi:hypothetical protein PILCRDRAFT_83832 [Piloderma croceum F 1598]|uniref:HAT C-terminal dimerisation domain-containing protein n=1 Tax=Piloderma croceum (strain F 1598) TaxID=765440 RepID=A0A0C3BYX6_PILCF|nr:hypothetical protein PILCRDRAFT_83832 [Piloderma croceum F 1598]